MMGNDVTHDLQGFSFEDRQELLPGMISALTEAGGWMLERKTTSPTTMQFRIEIELYGIVDLYALLAETGIEFTRATHRQLAALCTCRRFVAESPASSQLLTLSLEVSFVDEMPLHSFLQPGAAMA